MYVVLPSNSSMEYYPDNTLANYKVKLSKPLILEGEYEVAMVEIIYPHRRLSVEPQEAGMVIHSSSVVRRVEVDLRDMVDDYTPGVGVKEDGVMEYDMSSHHKKNKVSRHTLPAGMYEKPQELAIRLNRVDKDVSFGINPYSNKFKVKLAKGVVRVEFTRRMSQLLGFTQNPKKYVLTNSEEAKFMPHLEGNAHSLYIYSSIVDHQIVGDTAAPLLRVVCPDADKLGQTVSEKYIKPYYLPINTSYIDTIDIQIRTTTGHLFPFISGSPVVVSLHFRQRGK